MAFFFFLEILIRAQFFLLILKQCVSALGQMWFMAGQKDTHE